MARATPGLWRTMLARHSRLHDAAAWAGVLACGAVIAAGLWRGGGTLYPGPLISDLTYHAFPLRVFAVRAFGAGFEPLWNPHVFGGVPVLELQQMALYHPVSGLTTRLMDATSGLVATISLHVLTALIVTFAGLRYALRLPPLASWAGAGAYAFGTVFALRVVANHITVQAAMALAVGATAFAFRAAQLAARQTPRGWATRLLMNGPALAASALVSLTIVAGAPQYVLYLFYAHATAVLCATLTVRRGFRRRALTAAVSGAAAIWTLAMIATAAVWLPTLGYLPYSARADGGGFQWASGSDLWAAALSALLPFPLGDDVTQGHLHYKNVWEIASYPGVIALVLSGGLLLRAAATLRSGANARLLLAPAIAVLALALCYGVPLPGFGSFREPLKARTLLALTWASGTAVGLALIAARARRARGTPWPEVAVSAAVMAAAGAFALWARLRPEDCGAWLIPSQGPFDPLARPAYEAAVANPSLPAARLLSVALPVAAASAVAVLLLLLVSRLPRTALALLAAAAVAEPAAHTLHLFQARHEFADITLPEEVGDALREPVAAMQRGETLPFRVSLPPYLANRSHLMEGLHDAGGYDPLQPQGAMNRSAIWGSVRDDGARVPDSTIDRALGRRYLFARVGDSVNVLNRVTTESALISIERNVRAGAPPRDFYGPHADGTNFVVPGAFARQAALAGEADPLLAEWAVLHRTPGDGAANSITPEFRAQAEAVRRALPADGTSLLVGESITPLRNATTADYNFRVVLREPALVVWRMTWLPGWGVTVSPGDGATMPEIPRRIPALCANHWMCATFVEAGTWNVRFDYQPRWHGAARAISLGGLILFAGACAATWGLRRRQRPRL